MSTSEASKKKGPSRNIRSLRGLALLLLLAGALGGLNAFTTRRDISIAIGPVNAEQKAWLIGAADRPDIEQFYKALRADQRLKLAENLASHDDPKIVELTAKLLNTFDPAARKVLAESLLKQAPQRPEAVADQLKQGSSFQRFGVQKALDALGDQAIPLAVERLTKGDMRGNAANYLLTKGKAVIPPVIEVLTTSKDKDTRLAAADLLGKLRAFAAAEPLAQLYANPPMPEDADTNPPEEQAILDEKNAYLAAIASIGAPESTDLLLKSAEDQLLPPSYRAQVLLGLGRIGTKQCQSALWSFARMDDKVLRDAAYGGLRLIGDRALSGAIDLEEKLTVAMGLRSQAARDVIQAALADPKLVIQAAQASQDDPELAPALVRQISSLNIQERGREADALVSALLTTPEGARALQGLKANPQIAALIDRAF